MPDQLVVPISETELLVGDLAGTDLLVIVDGSDLTQSAAGTTKHLTAQTLRTMLFAGFGVLGTLVGNVTGDVTGNVTGSSGSTTGNAATATALQTARTINGVSFDGTGNITVTAAAGTLSGTALNATVVTSSLTAIGTLASGAVPASLVTTGTFGAGAYTFPGALNFTTRLTSTTDAATPSAFVATTATFLAGAVNGAKIMGYGTTNDVALLNRAGTVVLGITANTTSVTMAGALAIAGAFTGATTGAFSSSVTALGYTLTGNGGAISAATRYIDGGGVATAWQYNVPAGGTHAFSVNGVNQFTLNTASGSVFSAGTDASTLMSIGGGGGAPTSQRFAELIINTPSGGAGLGNAYVGFYRAGVAVWVTGVDIAVSGAKAANTDYLFLTGGANVAALTTAGRLRTNGGFYTSDGTDSGSISTGSIVTLGGMGVAKAVFLGTTLNVAGLTVLTGQVGVMGTAGTQAALTVRGTSLSGIQQFGITVTPTFNSSATSDGMAVYAQIGTAAAAFTQSSTYGFLLDAPTVGAGSSITNLYGIRINNQGAAGITYAYGIYIAAQSGAATTNIGLYNGGTLVQSGIAAFGTGAVSASTNALFSLSTTAISSLRIPHGAAPTSPVDGDVWTTTGGIFVRVNGVTKTVTTT